MLARGEKNRVRVFNADTVGCFSINLRENIRLLEGTGVEKFFRFAHGRDFGKGEKTELTLGVAKGVHLPTVVLQNERVRFDR